VSTADADTIAVFVAGVGLMLGGFGCSALGATGRRGPQRWSCHGTHVRVDRGGKGQHPSVTAIPSIDTWRNTGRFLSKSKRARRRQAW